MDYEGDRITGGPEGEWENHLDGIAAGTFDITTSYGSVYVYNTGAVAGNEAHWIANDHAATGISLGLSSTTCTKIRWRYKTTDTNIKAKIVIEFTDAATQEVLADSSSTTWVTGSATVTTGKTIKYVRLHADHATNQGVYYDFIQIYVDNFSFPNVVDIPFEPSSRNVNLGIVSGLVLGTQNLGADPSSIELVCDLDMETTTYDWTPTGYTDNDELFLDILHNQSVDAPWQWLTWGNKSCRFVIDRTGRRNLR
jgi:hypothetical protein